MRVGLFVTCLVDVLRPRIGFATLRLLEAAGAEAAVPISQSCCGQPGYNAGDLAAARVLGRKLAGEFRGCDYVVTPSGSCAAMIRHHYRALFRNDPAMLPEIERLAARTYELTDFLVNVAQVRAVPGRFAGCVTYHDSCSGLRELGVKRQPRALLGKVEGLQLREMREPETCCGFGGAFSVKFGDISSRMSDNKCGQIAASGADAVVAGDLGCLLNIEGRLRRRGDHTTRVLHIAEILAGDAQGCTSAARVGPSEAAEQSA